MEKQLSLLISLLIFYRVPFYQMSRLLGGKRKSPFFLILWER
jgi:hypothetical protein